MTNFRRQASSRISGSRRKSENSIGWFLSHGEPGERKSGTPHSVEMPAPVKPTARRAEPTSNCNSARPSASEFEDHVDARVAPAAGPGGLTNAGSGGGGAVGAPINRAADERPRCIPIAVSRHIPIAISRPVARAPVAHRRRVIADHWTAGRAPVNPVLIAIVDALGGGQVARTRIANPEFIPPPPPPPLLGVGGTRKRGAEGEGAQKRDAFDHHLLLLR